jgi:hypothetical protein
MVDSRTKGIRFFRRCALSFVDKAALTVGKSMLFAAIVMSLTVHDVLKLLKNKKDETHETNER